MANADELLDTLLELRAAGNDLRDMPVSMKQESGWIAWSGELDIDDDGTIKLWD